MAEHLEPFRLDFDLPEIGGRAGDWMDIDLSTSPPQLILMRRIANADAERVRRHVDNVSRFLARLPHREPTAPIARPRLEVDRD